LKEFANTLHKLAVRYEAMHAGGIVHRDCKLDNIMMKGSEPYPIDFGLSRPINLKTNNVADDVASFGKMILDFSSTCFAKTYGQSVDPVGAAVHPPTYIGFVPTSFKRYIDAMPKTLPDDYPVWKRVMSLGMKMYQECAKSKAVCARPYFSGVKGELNAIKLKAVVSSLGQ
jgi:serine/threonine protein kinase